MSPRAELGQGLSWAVGTQGQTVPCQPEILLCSVAMPNSCNTTGFGPLMLFFSPFFSRYKVFSFLESNASW